ncbi:MAG: hypothetical protein ACK559_16255, partial [bacterium]
AVATGKIYLSREFITANAQNVNAIAAVLLEEYGHYVDSRINTADTAGEKSGVKRRESDQENKTIKTSAVIQHLLPHSAENARCKRNQGFTGGVGRISDA